MLGRLQTGRQARAAVTTAALEDCRLAQPQTYADAELPAEQVAVGAVRGETGFGQQERRGVEQIGHVDEELPIPASERIKPDCRVEIDIERAIDPVALIGR